MRARIKQIQLWMHHHYYQIRHWIITTAILILLVFSMVSLGNQSRLLKRVESLNVQNKTLSEQNKALNQQTKQLGQDNQSIAKQNRSYIRCVADVFAGYTVTFRPITSLNLDNCTFNNPPIPVPTNTPSSPAETNQTTPSSPTSSTSNDTKKEDTNPSPPQPPNCIIDLLGLHIGCS